MIEARKGDRGLRVKNRVEIRAEAKGKGEMEASKNKLELKSEQDRRICLIE